jgi:hypothetical protein
VLYSSNIRLQDKPGEPLLPEQVLLTHTVKFYSSIRSSYLFITMLIYCILCLATCRKPAIIKKGPSLSASAEEAPSAAGLAAATDTAAATQPPHPPSKDL